MPEIIKKIFIFLIISGLCVSAFFVRLENFKKPVPRTIDETVYFIMAQQMQKNIFDYNAAAYGLLNQLTIGEHYPDYFFKPIFKHPPLFVFMIMGSIKMFGLTELGAGFFPLFLGSLAIALVYLLGRLVAGRMAGLLAAGLMWVDPVAIMSSQKVWMDTPLMFFMLLTVYGYWMAVKEKKNIFFLIGGLAAGSAFMIKYPGILTFFWVIMFFLMTSPETFRNRYFQWSLVLPVLMSLPWLLWNYYVYRLDFFRQLLALHGFSGVLSSPVLFLITLILVMGIFIWNVGHNASRLSDRIKSFFSSKSVFYVKTFGFFCMIIFSVMYAGKSLEFFAFPHVSWYQGALSGEPGWFYLTRILEYCFLYAFAYIAFFDVFFKKSNDIFLLKMSAFLIIFFFTIWRNYQCRYILPALPFLMILTSDYIGKLLKRFGKIDFVFLRLFLQAALLLLIVVALSKTMQINQQVSFTNNMCYF